MTPNELHEHQRHLKAYMDDLRERMPTMSEEDQARARKTLENLGRERDRAYRELTKGQRGIV